MSRPFLTSLLILLLSCPFASIIGDAIGAGLQFPFLKCPADLSRQVITVLRDLDYVTSGIITGRSALSIVLWVLGTLLLVAAIVYFAARRQEGYKSFRTPLSLLVGGAGGAYLASCFAQYGLTLHGPAGLAIPVGVPLIFAIAVYILKAEEDGEPEYEEEDEDDWEETEEGE